MSLFRKIVSTLLVFLLVISLSTVIFGFSFKSALLNSKTYKDSFKKNGVYSEVYRSMPSQTKLLLSESDFELQTNKALDNIFIYLTTDAKDVDLSTYFVGQKVALSAAFPDIKPKLKELKSYVELFSTVLIFLLILAVICIVLIFVINLKTIPAALKTVGSGFFSAGLLTLITAFTLSPVLKDLISKAVPATTTGGKAITDSVTEIVNSILPNMMLQAAILAVVGMILFVLGITKLKIDESKIVEEVDKEINEQNIERPNTQ